jgi:hypothetical protein
MYGKSVPELSTVRQFHFSFVPWNQNLETQELPQSGRPDSANFRRLGIFLVLKKKFEATYINIQHFWDTRLNRNSFEWNVTIYGLGYILGDFFSQKASGHTASSQPKLFSFSQIKFHVPSVCKHRLAKSLTSVGLNFCMTLFNYQS